MLPSIQDESIIEKLIETKKNILIEGQYPSKDETRSSLDLNKRNSTKEGIHL